MDIELLSKMVRELIMDNDSVALPGLGMFVAEMMPASFSDRGYTINPPYRKLVFRSRNADDGLLVSLYASSNSVSPEIASGVMGEFVGNLKTVLFTHRNVVFPGLGKLRATREGHVFFIADEDLDIYPAGLGLEPVSLKTHAKPTSLDFSEFDLQTPAHDASASEAPAPEASVPETELAPESEIIPEMETEAAPEPESAREQEVEPSAESTFVLDPWAESDSEDDEEEAEGMVSRRRRPVLVAVISVLCAAALVCGAFFVMAKWFPDALDHILYTKEELEILNYGK